VIFILLAGAPSHTDTFDFKNIDGVTPTTFKPTTVNGVLWPAGLLPKLGQMTDDFAVVRSMRAHAVVHSLSQTWVQIGRNPTAALGNIAPNIGSIVAIEKEKERSLRRSSDVPGAEFQRRGGTRLSSGELRTFKVTASNAASRIRRVRRGRRASTIV